MNIFAGCIKSLSHVLLGWKNVREKKSILSLRAVRLQAGWGQMAVGYSWLNPAEA